MAYLMQVQAMERTVLSLQAPAMDRGLSAPTLAETQAEFDAWLVSEPEQGRPVDTERAQLYEVLGVGGTQ